MTPDQFDVTYRAFGRRRPFQHFCIEFTGGTQTLVRHPEALRREGDLYAMRAPSGASMVFAAESVTRVFDASIQ